MLVFPDFPDKQQTWDRACLTFLIPSCFSFALETFYPKGQMIFNFEKLKIKLAGQRPKRDVIRGGGKSAGLESWTNVWEKPEDI